MLVPEMHFAHPVVRRIHDLAFPSACRRAPHPADAVRVGQPEHSLQESIVAVAAELKDALTRFVERFSIDVLFPQNVLAIPMHLPLGVALTDFITETGIPVIAHHHDSSLRKPAIDLGHLSPVLLDHRGFALNHEHIWFQVHQAAQPVLEDHFFRNAVQPGHLVALGLQERGHLGRDHGKDVGRAVEPLELAVLRQQRDTLVRF